MAAGSLLAASVCLLCLRAVTSDTWDQRQTGRVNVQVNMENFNISIVPDYYYYYEYEEEDEEGHNDDYSYNDVYDEPSNPSTEDDSSATTSSTSATEKATPSYEMLSIGANGVTLKPTKPDVTTGKATTAAKIDIDETASSPITTTTTTKVGVAETNATTVKILADEVTTTQAPKRTTSSGATSKATTVKVLANGTTSTQTTVSGTTSRSTTIDRTTRKPTTVTKTTTNPTRRSTTPKPSTTSANTEPAADSATNDITNSLVDVASVTPSRRRPGAAVRQVAPASGRRCNPGFSMDNRGQCRRMQRRRIPYGMRTLLRPLLRATGLLRE